MRQGFLERFKPRKLNWRYYFGGATLLLLLIQLITGLYMMSFYEPGPKDTYLSVQYLTNKTLFGALFRNMHRYGAFLIVIIAFFHMVRNFYRSDYIGRTVSWITGVALFLLVLGFTVSGAILPWEWRGYWFFEMFANFIATFPVIGTDLKNFFMDTYTPMRNFIVHNFLFPITALTLLHYHCLVKLKKRGLNNFFLKHFLLVLPFIAISVGLTFYYPIPSQDPQILPLPWDGRFFPAPEWFFVTFLIPFWHHQLRYVPIYTFYIPLALIALVIALPFLHRKKFPKTPRFDLRKILLYVPSTLIILFLFFGTIYGSYDSPWASCTACHNRAKGNSMGTPPVTFKDTSKNPKHNNQKWMMFHWYQPQNAW